MGKLLLFSLGLGNYSLWDSVGRFYCFHSVQCCCLSSQPRRVGRKGRDTISNVEEVEGRLEVEVLSLPNVSLSWGEKPGGGSRGKTSQRKRRQTRNREREPTNQGRRERRKPSRGQRVLVRPQPSVRRRKRWLWSCSTVRWQTFSANWRGRKITPRSCLGRKRRRTISRATPPFCRTLWAAISQIPPVLRKNIFLIFNISNLIFLMIYFHAQWP